MWIFRTVCPNCGERTLARTVSGDEKCGRCPYKGQEFKKPTKKEPRKLMKKIIGWAVLFFINCSLSFACEHLIIIQKESGDLEWCKECGEILHEKSDVVDFYATFVLDEIRCEYKGKRYINFKYAIKKILEEIEEECVDINDTNKKQEFPE